MSSIQELLMNHIQAEANSVWFAYNNEEQILKIEEVNPNSVKALFNIDNNAKIQLNNDGRIINETNNGFDSGFEINTTYTVTIVPSNNSIERNDTNNSGAREKKVMLTFEDTTKKFRVNGLTFTKIKQKLGINDNQKIQLQNGDVVIDEDIESRLEHDNEYIINIVEPEHPANNLVKRNDTNDSGATEKKVILTFEDTTKKLRVNGLTFTKIKQKLGINDNQKIQLENDDDIIDEDDDIENRLEHDNEYIITIVEPEQPTPKPHQTVVVDLTTITLERIDIDGNAITREIKQYPENIFTRNKKNIINKFYFGDNARNIDGKFKIVDKNGNTNNTKDTHFQVGNLYTVLFESNTQGNSINADQYTDRHNVINFNDKSMFNRIVFWISFYDIFNFINENIKKDIKLNDKKVDYQHIICSTSLKSILYQIMLSIKELCKNHLNNDIMDSLDYNNEIKLLLNKNDQILNKINNEFIDVLTNYLKNNETSNEVVDIIYEIQNIVLNDKDNNDHNDDDDDEDKDTDKDKKYNINKKKVFPIKIEDLTQQRKDINEFITIFDKHNYLHTYIETIKTLLKILKVFKQLIKSELLTLNNLINFFKNVKKNNGDDLDASEEIVNRLRAINAIWKILYPIKFDTSDNKQSCIIETILLNQKLIEVTYAKCEHIVNPNKSTVSGCN